LKHIGHYLFVFSLHGEVADGDCSVLVQAAVARAHYDSCSIASSSADSPGWGGSILFVWVSGSFMVFDIRIHKGHHLR
jgi:hypothetical protein